MISGRFRALEQIMRSSAVVVVGGCCPELSSGSQTAVMPQLDWETNGAAMVLVAVFEARTQEICSVVTHSL